MFKRMWSEQGERTIDGLITSEEETFKIYHAKDARHTSDSTKAHDNADANLRPAIDVAINENRDGDKHECPVCDDVDSSVYITGAQNEADGKTFPGASKTVC